MDHDEKSLEQGVEGRKVYTAPELEALGSLEEHTQVGARAGVRLDRGSS